jgi:hypothetical protein
MVRAAGIKDPLDLMTHERLRVYPGFEVRWNGYRFFA